MAFNPQEQEIIRAGIASGKSQTEIVAALSSYRTGSTPRPVSTNQIDPRPFTQKLTDFVGMSKAADVTASHFARMGVGPGTAAENRAVIPAPTLKQNIGTGLQYGGLAFDAATTPLSILNAVPVAGQAVNAAINAFSGYLYETGQDLLDDQGYAEALKPGLITAASAAAGPLLYLGGKGVIAGGKGLMKGGGKVVGKGVDALRGVGRSPGIPPPPPPGGTGQLADQGLGQMTDAVGDIGAKATSSVSPGGVLGTTGEFLGRVPRAIARGVDAFDEATARAARIAESSPVVQQAIKSNLGDDIINFTQSADQAMTEDALKMVRIAESTPDALVAKQNPADIAGQAAAKQYQIVERERRAVGQKIGDLTDELAAQGVKVDMKPAYRQAIDVLRANGMLPKVNGTLKFTTKKYTPQQQAAIQKLYDLAMQEKVMSPTQVHEMDQLFSKLQRELLDNGKVSDVYVKVPTDKGAIADVNIFKVFRQIFSDHLAKLSPEMKVANAEYRKLKNLVEDIEATLVKKGNLRTNADVDPAEYARTNLRRIFSDAASAADYKNIYEKLDKLSRELGYEGSRADTLSLFASKLRDLYPETIPKNSFQGGISTGIKSGLLDIAEKVLKTGAPDIRDQQQALKALLEDRARYGFKPSKKKVKSDDVADFSDEGDLTNKSFTGGDSPEVLYKGSPLLESDALHSDKAGGTWFTNNKKYASLYGEIDYGLKPKDLKVARFDSIHEAFAKYVDPELGAANATTDDYIVLRKALEKDGYEALEVGVETMGEFPDTLREIWMFERPKLLNKNDVADFSDEGGLTNEAVIAGRRVGTTGRYVGSPGVYSPQKMTALVKRLTDMVKKGEIGKDWYKRGAEHIKEVFATKQDQIDFAKLLAIFSPNATPEINYERAARAFMQYKDGLPIDAGGFGAGNKAAEAVLRGGKSITGEKVSAFFQNLLKYIDPRSADKNAVTNDIWMQRAFGYDKKTSGLATKQHEFMRNTIQKIAKDLNMTPDEAQAAIWVAVRNGGDEINRLIREGGSNFGKAAEKLYAQISWEAAPSKTSGLFPELFKAPWKQRAAYHAKIEAAMTDAKGRNMIFDLVGLPQTKRVRAPGVFEGEVSPGTQWVVEVPRKKGSRTEIDPVAYQKLQLASAIMGKMTNQDSVAFGKLFPAKNYNEANSALVGLGRTLTNDEAKALDKAMLEAFGEWGYALPGDKNGVRVLNFSDLTGTKFRDKLKEVTQKVWGGDTPVKIDYTVNHGELVNKTPHDYGENYGGAIARGSRDIQRGREVLQRIQQNIDRVIEDTKRDYGWTDKRSEVLTPADLSRDWIDGGTGGLGSGGTDAQSVLSGLRGNEYSEATLGHRGGGLFDLANQEQKLVSGGSDEPLQSIKVSQDLVDEVSGTLFRYGGSEKSFADKGKLEYGIRHRLELQIKTLADKFEHFDPQVGEDLLKHFDALPKNVQDHFEGIQILTSRAERENIGGQVSFPDNETWKLVLNPNLLGSPLYKSGRIISHEVRGHLTYAYYKPELRAKVNEVLLNEVLTKPSLVRELYTPYGKDVMMFKGVADHYYRGAISHIGGLINKIEMSESFATKVLTDLKYINPDKTYVRSASPVTDLIRATNIKLKVQDYLKKNYPEKIRAWKWGVDEGYTEGARKTFYQRLAESNADDILNETFARLVEHAHTEGIEVVPKKLQGIIKKLLDSDDVYLSKSLIESQSH